MSICAYVRPSYNYNKNCCVEQKKDRKKGIKQKVNVGETPKEIVKIRAEFVVENFPFYYGGE